MRPSLLSVFLFFMLTAGVPAQQHYADDIYERTDKHTQIYFEKPGEVLQMDIFSPSPDTLLKKPVLLYVHGGGFSGGSRVEERHLDFCRRFARKGFLAITIDYTLQMKGKSFGCDRPATEKISTFLKTGQDISRAVAHVVSHHKKLGVDTSNIVIAGSSAGAEAVLHAAYWKATRSVSTGQILPDNFRYGGVISMAGAITNLRWITENNAIPTQLFHGTCDNLVPYGTASHHYCQTHQPGYLMLFGPAPIMDKLESLNKPFYGVTGCYGMHEWNALPLSDYDEEIVDFLVHDVIQNQQRQIRRYIQTGRKPCSRLNAAEICED